ncbi:MAG: 1-deoxy-D-xylulose-5-phosphate reductoisomerase [Deltaproteobacteria bacterium]|nr:1-deoxy-D-xylulose-5-phosphate reductoisomerase [Deltaproteobacteria bacterium]
MADLNKHSNIPSKGLAVLGSTGSIGRNTLEVVRFNPGRFKVVSLAAGNNVEGLKKQIQEFRPACVSVANDAAARELKKTAAMPVEICSGAEGAMKAASYEGVDMAVSAISGAAGLIPTLAAIRAGKDIALANKETLVMAGPIILKEIKKSGVRLLPVDSEHSAIFQSLCGHRREDLKGIILTASGGPFLTASASVLDAVTPEAATMHPKWSMGRKISVDSATLMNKGLEVIEAAFLFDLLPEKISVVIHPQAIVHSMVEYIDGSIVAQMSQPDMRGAIAYAISYPERIECGTPPLKLHGLNLEFFEPDVKRFPCLTLAYDAIRAGGTMPAVLNAADEIAVDGFLKGNLGFTCIYGVISGVMEKHSARSLTSIETVLEADRWARQEAAALIRTLG